MEPLVLFGAGLVVYCGYIAVMDEISDFKRCRSKSAASCESRTTKAAGLARPKKTAAAKTKTAGLCSPQRLFASQCR